MAFHFGEFNQEKRLIAVKYTLLLALAIGIALSYNLWLTEARYFPLTPLFDFFPSINPPFDYMLLYILILIIAVGFIYPFNFLLNISLFILLLFLGITDLNRFQPWVYQYILMLMIFSFTVKKTIPTYIYPALQLLICGVFFWSGIFKFNQLYFSEVVAWFAKPFNGSIFVQSLGLLLPVLEVFTAIGLLLIKTRKAAIITAIVVHLYYLLVTGPLGNNFNTVLWPWSFAMPLFVLLLFSGKHSYFSQNLTGFFHLNITKATLVLAWIIPIFNLFNIWPAYTSFNIYSGNTNNGILYLSDQTELMLPETVGKLVKNNTINIKEWSMQELNVPAFPEKRIFLKTRNYMMDFATDSSEVVLFYQPKTKLYGTSVAENY